jgi:hypothetical protein
MAIFNSYVSLPEGKLDKTLDGYDSAIALDVGGQTMCRLTRAGNIRSHEKPWPSATSPG